MSNAPSRDPISVIATVGAPVLVASLLVYRIANGLWWSVAFMGLIFAAVFVFYLIFVIPGLKRFEKLDEDVGGSDSQKIPCDPNNAGHQPHP